MTNYMESLGWWVHDACCCCFVVVCNGFVLSLRCFMLFNISYSLFFILFSYVFDFSLITAYRWTILLDLLRCPIRLTIEMVSISIDLWMVRYQDIYRMHLYSNHQIKYTFYHNEYILLVVHLRESEKKKTNQKKKNVKNISLLKTHEC